MTETEAIAISVCIEAMSRDSIGLEVHDLHTLVQIVISVDDLLELVNDPASRGELRLIRRRALDMLFARTAADREPF